MQNQKTLFNLSRPEVIAIWQALYSKKCTLYRANYSREDEKIKLIDHLLKTFNYN